MERSLHFTKSAQQLHRVASQVAPRPHSTASRRFLDHIVVTSDTAEYMPAKDRDEQIVIRSDRRLADFTTDYSDHVPVAVRFVIGEDAD